MKKITVRIKNVYGRETIYPVCADAKTFAALANTITLTRYALKSIKTLGYKIEVEQISL